MDSATMLELLRLLKVQHNYLPYAQHIDQLCGTLEEECAHRQRVSHSQLLPPDSHVTVHTQANGEILVSIRGKSGTLQLEVSPDPEDPAIALRDPVRGTRDRRQYKFCIGVGMNGKLEGWFVEEARDPPGYDQVAWIPAQTPRIAKKRKRTTKPER